MKVTGGESLVTASKFRKTKKNLSWCVQVPIKRHIGKLHVVVVQGKQEMYLRV